MARSLPRRRRKAPIIAPGPHPPIVPLYMSPLLRPARLRLALSPLSLLLSYLALHPGDEEGRMLHSTGLRTAGKFDAFASGADVIMKLPAARVAGSAELHESDTGACGGGVDGERQERCSPRLESRGGLGVASHSLPREMRPSRPARRPVSPL